MPSLSKPFKAVGRTLNEFKPLKSGEEKLLDACRAGDVCQLDTKLPTEGSSDNTVRASFIRFLALGGDELAPIHEHGIQLHGAWIEGMLDLEAARVTADFGLFNCEITGTSNLRGALIQGSLFLSGSRMAGLMADGAVIKGSVFLDEKFSAMGEVRLMSVQIGGVLTCSGATLNCKDGDSLSVDRAVIKGSVFLDKEFSSIGTVRLLDTHIGGNLSFSGATLDGNGGAALAADRAIIKGCVFLDKQFTSTGEVCLIGTQIGSNLQCNSARFNDMDGTALSFNGMVVSGSFIFRNLPTPVNCVSLNHAQVGRLVDDLNAWGSDLTLDGFSYGSIADDAPTNAAKRLVWLDRQRASHAGLQDGSDNFRPQPWRQLQKVLREMGHAEDARQVAIAFENRLRKAGLIGQSTKPEWHPSYWLGRPVKISLHWLFGKLIGYGYRPLLLGNWMLAIWLSCAVFYWYAALQGTFAPSNPLVFQNPQYSECMPYSNPAKLKNLNTPVHNEGNWYLCSKLPEEYTGFSPITYSLDVLLPFVDLQQQNDWAPLIPTPSTNWDIEIIRIFDLKHLTRLIVWLEIIFGWIASLLLVAVVSGLSKRHEE